MSAGVLLLIAAFGIGLILFLVIVVRLQAFVALLLTSLIVAVMAGIPLGEITGVIQEGMGGVLGFVAIVVGLGTMIGRLMEVTGGAEQIARTLLARSGEERAQWAMGLTGFIVAIPVFFDVGLIILISLVYGIARTAQRSLLYYAIPLLAGLAIAHAYIPPTPGPVAVAAVVGADLGWVILFGALCGIPGLILGGFVFGRFIGDRIFVEEPEYMLASHGAGAEVASGGSGEGGSTAGGQPPADEHAPEAGRREPPSFGLVTAIVLLPLGLILINTVSGVVLAEDSPALPITGFIGHPFTALTAATLLAMYWLGIKQGYTRDEVQQIATASLEPVGLIILVTGAGGVFGRVLVEAGVGEALADTLAAWRLPVVVLAFVIALGVRVSQGGATVAMITAASIVAPVVETGEFTPPQIALVVVAIASGATALSHVNDSGFWLVSRYLGLTEKQTFASWTALVTIIGFSGFAVALILSLLV
jgi:Gnt-I system low-affinity gluconate transporter